MGQTVIVFSFSFAAAYPAQFRRFFSLRASPVDMQNESVNAESLPGPCGSAGPRYLFSFLSRVKNALWGKFPDQKNFV